MGTHTDTMGILRGHRGDTEWHHGDTMRTRWRRRGDTTRTPRGRREDTVGTLWGRGGDPVGRRAAIPAAGRPSAAAHGRPPTRAVPAPRRPPGTAPPRTWRCRSPAGTARGTAAPGRPGTARHNTARHGTTRPGTTRPGTTRPVPARRTTPDPPPSRLTTLPLPSASLRCRRRRPSGLWVTSSWNGRTPLSTAPPPARPRASPARRYPHGVTRTALPAWRYPHGVEVRRWRADDVAFGAHVQEVQQRAAARGDGDADAQGDGGDGGRALIVQLRGDAGRRSVRFGAAPRRPHLPPPAAPYLVDVLHAHPVVVRPAAVLNPRPLRGQHRGGRQGRAGGARGVTACRPAAPQRRSPAAPTLTPAAPSPRALPRGPSLPR